MTSRNTSMCHPHDCRKTTQLPVLHHRTKHSGVCNRAIRLVFFFSEGGEVIQICLEGSLTIAKHVLKGYNYGNAKTSSSNETGSVCLGGRVWGLPRRPSQRCEQPCTSIALVVILYSIEVRGLLYSHANIRTATQHNLVLA